MALPKTMKAVVFDGPRKVSLQDRPVPRLQEDTDIIVKVQAAALCGSELHVYRGHQPSATGFIMGHEFTGTVVEAGSAVQSVSVGDKIVAPFTISCGKCFYCLNGGTARCAHSRLFGSPLDGSQASYVRVPLADGTVSKAHASISDEALILMADIFPTGYFGVKSALALASPTLKVEDSTIVVVGCGPVGLCAIVAAAERKPRHLFAIDSVGERLEQARKLGAEPLNFMTDREAMVARVKEVTEGRGADMVVEVVGLSPALRTAFDLVRPFGVISSIGVHNAEIPWSGSEAYGKNIRLQMGRCPVRSVFPEALELLEKKQHLLGFMFENVMPLSKAVEGYTLFDEMKVQKVIFKPDEE
ncbi:Medium chain reductase/dehydrogenase ucsI [Cladobotryum mycophilum]|uniref:Medium chain reductase/dehydrogenase ucsI n=1 Tax=Cladobotryum mycophilum TaxID=491253 RepID=A0ABR0SPA4_9HYPO